MSYTFVSNLTTINRTVGRTSAIKYIVIHYTGNKTDTAINNAKYFKSVNRRASAHYFVDKTHVVQVVKDSDTAWAVGKNFGSKNLFYTVKNANSINIEMCSDNGTIAEETFNNTVELTKKLMAKYNISANHVYRHYDICLKRCPGWDGWLGSNPTHWNRFKAAISNSSIQTKSGILQLYTYNGSDAQKWKVIKNNDNTYSFKNVSCGLNMDITGAIFKLGSLLQVYTPNASNAQKFKLVKVGSNYRLQPAANSALSVDVTGNVNIIGTKIELYTNNNTGAQLFKIKKHSNDIWSFIKADTNMALDVAGGAALNKTYSSPSKVTTESKSSSTKTTTTSKVNQHLKDLQGALNDDYKTRLVKDGIYGNNTAKALSKVVLSTSTKNKYKNVTAWVQIRVGTTPDGIFGNGTKSSVIAYQKKKGLTADGIVGIKTMKAILKDMGVNC